ncbi:MAG: hypothetical protein ACK5PP_00910 [Acidimicrobiales bacterium]
MTASALAVAIVVSAVGLNGTALGWGLAVATVAVALIATAAVPAVRARPGGGHPRPSAPFTPVVVRSASFHADRLWRAADTVPPGPVADHLTDLAVTADRYVALANLDPGRVGGPDQILTDLAALTDAAERLARTRIPSGPTPLQDLAERTDLMAHALGEDIDPATPLS